MIQQSSSQSTETGETQTCPQCQTSLLRTSELQRKIPEDFFVSAVVQESKWTWWPFPLYAFLRLNRASAGWREQLQVIIILINLALLNWVPARLGPDRN